MGQNKQLSLQFASISGKKVTADFTGGDVTSDVGVLAMREVADKIGIIEQLAQAIHDERHQSSVLKQLSQSSMATYVERKGARLHSSCQSSV